MSARVRSDVIARRFCDGASIGELAYKFGVRPDEIEQALRRRLEVLLERKRA